MSAPVDVLAVMDRARVKLDLPGLELEIAEARAAVAELIAAATMANGDHSAPHDCYATGPLTGDYITDLVVCPGCRLSNALARIGGAK